AKASRINRGQYECVRTTAQLKAWAQRIADAGLVAIKTATTGDDPMTARLSGIALAVADNEACYVPIGHREAGQQSGSDLFAPEAKLCAGQIAEADVLDALRPVLDNPSVLKIGQNLKFDWQI